MKIAIYVARLNRYEYQTKTLSVRVKDKHAKVLREMAYEINQVFNLANELTFKANRRISDYGQVKPVWLSAFDIQKQTAGIQKERGWSTTTPLYS